MPLQKTSAHLFSNTKGCNGIQGAELKLNQTGGGLGSESHATRFNHSGSASYGFDEKGAAIAHEMRGSYAAMTENPSGQQCGGKKRRTRRRKSKKKAKKRRTKRRATKRRTKRRATKRRTKRKLKKRKNSKKKVNRKKSKKRVQRGGSSISYSIIDNSLKGEDARILGTHSMSVSDKNCGDNYNHFTGGKSKSLY